MMLWWLLYCCHHHHHDFFHSFKQVGSELQSHLSSSTLFTHTSIISNRLRSSRMDLREKPEIKLTQMNHGFGLLLNKRRTHAWPGLNGSVRPRQPFARTWRSTKLARQQLKQKCVCVHPWQRSLVWLANFHNLALAWSTCRGKHGWLQSGLWMLKDCFCSNVCFTRHTIMNVSFAQQLTLLSHWMRKPCVQIGNKFLHYWMNFDWRNVDILVYGWSLWSHVNFVFVYVGSCAHFCMLWVPSQVSWKNGHNVDITRNTSIIKKQHKQK